MKGTGDAEDIGPCLGVRHLIIFLLFLCATVGYAMRANLSIAIVNMTDKNCSDSEQCQRFDWDEQLKTVILSSFFWGYVVLQVPSSLLAQRFGIKWLLLLGTGISSLGTVLTPIAATTLGWGGVCAMRMIEGFAQGTLYPSIHAALAVWAPPEERGLLASFAFSGSQIGTIVTFVVSGYLAASSVGWPLIFYVFGGLGFAWCLLWFFVAANNPAEHSFISEKEKNYIERSVSKIEMKATFRTPWGEIAKSVPMWAILIAHCAQNWGFWILLTGIPTYMSKVLGQNIQANGLLSSLPYLAMAILSYVFGWIQDFTIKKKMTSLATSRKIFNSIAFWGGAAALLYLSFVTKEQKTLAVVLLVVTVGVNAGVYIGFQVNHIDLSPNFAGTMMGITNCVSNIFSIIGPLVVGFIGTGNDSSEQWKMVFWITSAVYFLGNLIFIFLGKAERQPWDDPNYKKNKSADNVNVTSNTVTGA
ncbi:UNVERIFIED_CONTAM: hypothetical protein PYX00_005477 [Menopon gallinae]|uniref:Putative inorganic phosphate cotransporter n=1 Tax=Menopon gallinae TaxID=328185 RepID=A0AAW2HRG7_9NEOP